jgi:hypothetical protein
MGIQPFELLQGLTGEPICRALIARLVVSYLLHVQAY